MKVTTWIFAAIILVVLIAKYSYDQAEGFSFWS